MVYQAKPQPPITAGVDLGAMEEAPAEETLTEDKAEAAPPAEAEEAAS